MNTRLLSSGVVTGRRERHPDQTTPGYRRKPLACKIFHRFSSDRVLTFYAERLGAVSCGFLAGSVSCGDGCGKEFELFAVGKYLPFPFI